MAKNLQSWTVGELAKIVDGHVEGDQDAKILRPVPAGNDDPQAITFATSAKYLETAKSVRIGAIIAPPETIVNGVNLILVSNPKRAFSQILSLMKHPLPIGKGIHPSATISSDATLHKSCSIGANCVVEAGAILGENVQIFAGCYIGENCKVGSNTILYPNVSLLQDVEVGENCILNAGAVIGSDGFGFDWDGEKQLKTPHIGRVIIKDNVEIGANTCIDRAVCGETVIGEGVKLDNLIQIGHNVTIGAHTVIAAQVGISGSVDIGSRVTMGGQAAVSDHVKIADNVVLGGRTGVTSDITEEGQYFGLPATPIIQAMKATKLHMRLPELFQRLRKLEQELERLKNDG